ncbi:hypothetical protein [Nocardia vinacea]|uniref:hypothetical protein n=1 Tax=Nocardia vinacea TaxID=96468 RepID=UPI00030B2E46|nr:hypothetical protein [Nocardia vinacea]
MPRTRTGVSAAVVAAGWLISGADAAGFAEASPAVHDSVLGQQRSRIAVAFQRERYSQIPSHIAQLEVVLSYAPGDRAH